MANIFLGKLIRLRSPEPSDDAVFRDWDRQDTDIRRALYKIEFPEPRLNAQPPASEIRSHEGEDFDFTIETLNGVVVGSIHPHHCNLQWGTFMYGLSIFPDYRRRGYASEAIRLVLRYYFDERRYQKCTVEVYSFNEASARLHERLGFTLEGRLRRMVYSGGTFHDALYYWITREEFQSQAV